MTRRILLSALCFCCAWLCIAGVATTKPQRARPAWTARSWVLLAPRPGGLVEARVWFSDDAQRFEWSALRTGRNLPDGPQWRTGASKTEREAKAAADAAVEELCSE